ncbi:MAG: patatin-like phospholipase family protein [Thermovirgaceae bacterium]|nr:patatin-like phospholipase family protein [Synergistales bacterium]MDI9393687.1 patatin-like phospholipase family protein [Synergistota bacterium]MDY0179035.1 patatin-like phospholipase family protein [Synergistaceae bacterium]HRW87212.1 patatin-like phospholipase family protein [Thermovirgaceae bacterium]MDD3134667.1 patatin-like phospholipase family protein [Synergistales bacterium]
MRRLTLIMAAIAVLLTLALSSAASAGVVLVLSGGGTRGLAHIGVLKVLEERNIPIDGIVGTSIGSIVGGLAACGYSSSELDEMIVTLDLASLLYDSKGESTVPPGEDASAYIQSILRLEFNERGHITGPLGGLSGKKLLERLQQWSARCPDPDFFQLPIPFAAVATDIVTGEAVVLRRGNLASAMRASMAIPGLFSPWTIDGRLLVDGGLVSNAPVLIARELFPGRPLVLVDVTGRGKDREDIRTVVDIVDQMITIMTQRNVQEEIGFADLVITPDVGDLPMLEMAEHKEIVTAGEKAAWACLGLIEEVASRDRSSPGIVPSIPAVNVADIQVRGLGPHLSEDVRKRHVGWIGRPADPSEIIQVCTDLRARDDVRTADFWLEHRQDGTAVVVLNVEKEPVWEVAARGYASNLNPYSSLYLDITRRDLLSEGDSLRTHLGLGEHWRFGSRYLSPVREGYRRWEISAKAGSRRLTPEGSDPLEWDRYSLALSGINSRGQFRASLGYAGEFIHFDGEERTHHGPLLTLAWDGLDDPFDPAEGFSASLSAWWMDTSSLLARMDLLWVTPLGERWRLLVKGGATAGDASRPYHSVYLGTREELLSLASRPLAGENAAWGGMAFRRVFQRSWWGTVNLDIIANVGQSYGPSWERLESAWEAGLALSLPGRFLNGRLLVIYDDRSEWTFGFTIGRPFWDTDPLP